jgi:hypothetical protein
LTCYDVFNGDADGICALLQLRLAMPQEAVLVTGVKRDVSLLRRVPCAPQVRVTVLDVSADQNREALLALLQAGAEVAYFDHHYAGELPVHAGLSAHIDTAAQVCTSILVDRHLNGAHRRWAVAGAFGDNLADAARKLGASLGLDAAQWGQLQELGEAINYNAYVDSEADLIVHPAELFGLLRRHGDPLAVMDAEPVLRRIRDTRRQDLALAQGLAPHAELEGGRVFLLPDEPWSRRVRGAWGNQLVHQSPAKAHAVLSPGEQGGLVVSVRAPLERLRGADALCRQFPTGGGRAGAAGINHLPADRLEDFVRAFGHAFDPGPAGP